MRVRKCKNNCGQRLVDTAKHRRYCAACIILIRKYKSRINCDKKLKKVVNETKTNSNVTISKH